MTFIAPDISLNSFTCPHCGAISRQYHWGYSRNHMSNPLAANNQGYTNANIKCSQCEHCNEILIWYEGQLIYPDRGNAPQPNSDMPKDVKNIYEEATQVFSKSPRSASALLRLAIQNLCVYLGGAGKNTNDDIKFLVKNGLPGKIQKALDVVRVTGNHAVHPGQIDVDDPATAGDLFILTNIIVEYMISLPQKVESLYDDLPDDAKNAIQKRDE